MTMSHFEIHNRWTGAVLFALEAGSLRLTVEAAVTVGADLCGANLRWANLHEANLRWANLHEANLCWADLCGADLRRANLRGADLGGADLRGADLRGADLREADLRGADLRWANLLGADLLALHRTSIVPETGAFEGYKQCRGGVIVHLRIPREAARSSASGRKCRAQCADVLAVYGATEGVSLYDGTTTYRVGERVTCDTWDQDRWNECGGGIHFYLGRIEAEANAH